MPTQIGSTASPPESFRITMGILVTGSIIKPRIFISTSIPALYFGSDYHFSHKAIRKTCRDAHIGVTANGRLDAWRHCEIERLILRGAAHPLSASIIPRFNHYFSYFANVTRVADLLYLPLTLHEDPQTPRLLFL